jgi:Protein of unknown function (DUF1638)
MSNSATAKTSTTVSSPNSASNQAPEQVTVDVWAHPAVPKRPPSWSAAQREPIEIVACGALAAHIREIATRRGWQVTVRPIAAALHNRPQQIPGDAKRAIAAAQESGARTVIAYADCGTYGALDTLATEAGVSRLPGLHCYDLYAGEALIEHLFAEEPGTYLLTDYLIRTFDKAVIKPLGLDRYPDLWSDYFGHYRRLVWLAQQPTTELEEAATRIASQFNLPLTRIDTGTTGLEAALAQVIEPPS